MSIYEAQEVALKKFEAQHGPATAEEKTAIALWLIYQSRKAQR